MKKYRIFKNILLVFIFIIGFSQGSIFAYDADNIYAYPVPFNPKNGTKKYMEFKNLPTGSDIEIKIFDINGGLVFKKEFSTVSSVIWNGRNESGNLVSPGLYIIRVTVEDRLTGDYGKKLIRILVRY